jgi:hypothetical protein
MNEAARKKHDVDILFSKAVKAGKRIYYLDVKKDRHQELYLSITESKRVWSDEADGHPAFEKHKIFLYREDLNKFAEAFTAVANYARENAPESSFPDDQEYFSESQCHGDSNDIALTAIEDDNLLHRAESEYRLDIDF